MIAALLGLNALWVVRDLKPPAELEHNRGLGPTGYACARQRPRCECSCARSPHDGAAMPSLAGADEDRDRAMRLAGARILHSVPTWWPSKSEQLLRGRDTPTSRSITIRESGGAAWTQCVRDDPLHPLSPQSRSFSQSALELLKIYTFERRLDGGTCGSPGGFTSSAMILLNGKIFFRIRIETELFVKAPLTDSEKLRRRIAADPEDWQARRNVSALDAANPGEHGGSSETHRSVPEGSAGRPTGAARLADHPAQSGQARTLPRRGGTPSRNDRP